MTERHGDEGRFERSEPGELIPDDERFPSGLAPLITHIHEAGLRVGLYRGRHNEFAYEESDAKHFSRLEADFTFIDGYADVSAFSPAHVTVSNTLSLAACSTMRTRSWRTEGL